TRERPGRGNSPRTLARMSRSDCSGNDRRAFRGADSMRSVFATACVFLLTVAASGADWRQFRGPGGLGISEEKGLPTEWSGQKNVVWKIKLPGAGASS